MPKPTTKDALLLCLKTSAGHWLSGEALSEQLHVSRAAISKHVKTLRDEGYAIASATGKGYRLDAAPDRLLPAEIRAGLDTRIFGQQDITHFTETDSTHLRARELAEKGAPEGTMVIAETQNAGRGRRGRKWFSPQGTNIYVSWIVRPPISPDQAPRMTLLTAVAAADAIIAQSGIGVHIKWPNDLLVKGKKLGGILTEIRTEMDLVEYVIIGLGINVNTGRDTLTDIRDQAATSLKIETGALVSRVDLIKTFFRQFEHRYRQFLEVGFEPILKRWKELANIIGKAIAVDVAGKRITGTVVDVEDSGVLVVKDESGQMQRIFSGDVVMV